jgi:hypothetical protein
MEEIEGERARLDSCLAMGYSVQSIAVIVSTWAENILVYLIQRIYSYNSRRLEAQRFNSGWTQ